MTSTSSSYKIPKYLWHVKIQCASMKGQPVLYGTTLGEEIPFYPTYTPNLSSGIKP